MNILIKKWNCITFNSRLSRSWKRRQNLLAASRYTRDSKLLLWIRGIYRLSTMDINSSMAGWRNLVYMSRLLIVWIVIDRIWSSSSFNVILPRCSTDYTVFQNAVPCMIMCVQHTKFQLCHVFFNTLSLCLPRPTMVSALYSFYYYVSACWRPIMRLLTFHMSKPSHV